MTPADPVDTLETERSRRVLLQGWEQFGESVVLDGAKRFVAGAAGAAGFIVSARGAQGLGLYWVDAKAEGVALRHEWRADAPATLCWAEARDGGCKAR